MGREINRERGRKRKRDGREGRQRERGVEREKRGGGGS